MASGDAQGLCTPSHLCFLLLILVFMAHVLVGCFIYLPEQMLFIAGVVPDRPRASLARCQAFNWADPTYYRAVGGLSRRQQHLFATSNQPGGVFLEYDCYDSMCGLALPSMPRHNQHFHAMMPLPNVNVTAFKQLPQACQAIMHMGMTSDRKQAKDCLTFCRQSIGYGPRPLATFLCPISASDLGGIYGSCTKLEIHVWSDTWANTILLFGCALCAFAVFSYVLHRPELVPCYTPVPMACPLDDQGVEDSTAKDIEAFASTKCIFFALSFITHPFLATACMISYLHNGELWLAVATLWSATCTTDPLHLGGFTTLYYCWISRALTRDFLEHVVVVGRVSGVLLGSCAAISLHVSACTFMMDLSAVLLRFLVMIVALGLSLPSAVEADTLLEEQRIGNVQQLAWTKVPIILKPCRWIKFCPSLVVISSASLLTALISSGHRPLWWLASLPALMLLILSFPSLDDPRFLLHQLLKCQNFFR